MKKVFLFVGLAFLSSVASAQPAMSVLCSFKIATDSSSVNVDDAEPVSGMKIENNFAGGRNFTATAVRGNVTYEFKASTAWVVEELNGVPYETVAVSSEMKKFVNGKQVGDEVTGAESDLKPRHVYKSYFTNNEASVACEEAIAPPPPR